MKEDKWAIEIAASVIGAGMEFLLFFSTNVFKIRKPALLAGFQLCGRRDSNSHTLSGATTSK